MAYGAAIWWRALLAGVVALSLQVGVNYANDYSDGVKGTDAARVGPIRLVASGLATPEPSSGPPWSPSASPTGGFGPGGGGGLVVVSSRRRLCGSGVVLHGRARPYGYVGLGEVSVFVFFGLVATTGTAYVQTDVLTRSRCWPRCPCLMAVALLVVNNLRDIPGDRCGKRTLAVRMGPVATPRFYDGCVLLAILLVIPIALIRPWALLGLGALPLAFVPVRAVASGADGPALIPVLGATGRAQLALGILLAIGLAL